jgi:hypothetical protein
LQEERFLHEWRLREIGEQLIELEDGVAVVVEPLAGLALQEERIVGEVVARVLVEDLLGLLVGGLVGGLLVARRLGPAP